jgi:hypothetical protein
MLQIFLVLLYEPGFLIHTDNSLLLILQMVNERMIQCVSFIRKIYLQIKKIVFCRGWKASIEEFRCYN